MQHPEKASGFPRSSWQMGRSPDRSEPAGGIETDGFTDFSKNQSES